MSNRTAPAPGRPAARAARNDMSGTRSLVMNGELVLYGVVDPFAYDEFDGSIRAIDVMAVITSNWLAAVRMA